MFDSIPTPMGLRLRLATHTDLPQVKRLDDLAFADQEGVSIDDLNAILASGAIILLEESSSGRLVGESQVLFGCVPFLEHPFRPDTAFYYGTGIDPGLQGTGLGKVLAAAQDQVARQSGKTEAELTIRPENYQSLRLRFLTGFSAVQYLPDFYGPAEENGARLLLRKSYASARPNYSSVARIPVCFGSTPDLPAHRTIAEHLARGFCGFNVQRDEEPCMLFGK
jgi:predicted GNAT superfamily acetyltransferase